MVDDVIHNTKLIDRTLFSFSYVISYRLYVFHSFWFPFPLSHKENVSQP